MRNQYGRFFVTIASVCALVALCAVSGAAQRRYRPRAYTKAQVDAVIRRVEDRADNFVRVFDNALDNSRMDGRQREDRLNERARELEQATNELRSEFDRRERYADTRSEVSRCLNIATQINNAVRRRRLGGNAEQQWRMLRAELNALADVYGLARLR
jgi:exonuclease VII large subunit